MLSNSLRDSCAVDQQGLNIHEAVRQLGLKVRENDPDDIEQLEGILTRFLHYPSDELAQLHHEANRLGQYDETDHRQTLRTEFTQNGLEREFCRCCYLVRQKPLSFWTKIQQIETLDESTMLYFIDMKYFAVMFLISFLVYGLYATITNVMAGDKVPTSVAEYLNRISMGSKINHMTVENSRHYVTQIWIGVLFVLSWIIFFLVKEAKRRQVENEQDDRNTTASDFTVMIENLPKHYTKESLQAELDAYWLKVRQYIVFPNRQLHPWDDYDGRFTISKFNTARAYYEVITAIEQQEELDPLEKELKADLDELKDWLQYRQTHDQFPAGRIQRKRIYKRIVQLRDMVKQRRKDLIAQVEEDFQEIDRQKSTRLAFVTFNHNYARINLTRLNEPGVVSIPGLNDLELPIPHIKITRAPEPQDILWDNIGLPRYDRNLRKILTFSTTCVALIISFFVVYRMTLYQANKSTTVNVMVALFIVCYNTFLQYVITLLTAFEKDYRTTYYQVSLAYKITAAQLINSILIPIFVNHYSFKSIYQPGGISDDIIYFTLSNALVSPLFRLIDFGHRIRQLLWCYSARPHNKIEFDSQTEYNKYFEGDEFEVGYEYVYLLKTALYTCFYMSLQSIITLFAAGGIALYMLAAKCSLFYWCQRPKTSSSIVYKMMNTVLRLCMLAFAIGSITWTHLIPIIRQNDTIKPNVAALALALIIVWSDLAKEWVIRNDETPLNYQQQRLFLVSEYDRSNPATRKQAFRQFKDYVEQQKRFNSDQQSVRKDVSNLLGGLLFNQVIGAAPDTKPKDQAVSRISAIIDVNTNKDLELKTRQSRRFRVIDYLATSE